MGLNLRVVLLIVAAISLLGIIAESIRRNRMRRQQANRRIELPVTEDLFDDGIIGTARVIQPADPTHERRVPKVTKPVNPSVKYEVKVDTPAPSEVPYLQNASQNDLIVFYIMPKSDATINGRILKDTLLRANLEFSNMQIFNYYANEENFKDLQFCIASAFEPGTFDLLKMTGIDYQGLCCFMSAKHRFASTAYNNMLQILDKIAKALDAVLCDDQRNPCGNSYIKQCQQRIQSNR